MCHFVDAEVVIFCLRMFLMLKKGWWSWDHAVGQGWIRGISLGEARGDDISLELKSTGETC